MQYKSTRGIEMELCVVHMYILETNFLIFIWKQRNAGSRFYSKIISDWALVMIIYKEWLLKNSNYINFFYNFSAIRIFKNLLQMVSCHTVCIPSSDLKSSLFCFKSHTISFPHIIHLSLHQNQVSFPLKHIFIILSQLCV